MKFAPSILVLAGIALCHGASAVEQNEAGQVQMDSYAEDFLQYKPLVIPKRIEKKPEPVTPPTPSAQAPKAPQKESVDVAWLRKNYPMIEERAINNPTRENIEAYVYTKRVILDKSQRFQEAVDDVVRSDALVSENTRVPYATAGATSIRNADIGAQHQAVRELAKKGGLLVFVDGTCRFCAQQMPIIEMLRLDFGMESLVVSLDGSRPKGYNGPIVKDNGMYRKLEMVVTPSIAYLPNPKPYQDGKDPNTYLKVAEGFYALDELTKMISLAGYRKTDILSADVRKNLKIWDTGVASTDDLNSLKLNPDDPASFKKALAPILTKQY